VACREALVPEVAIDLEYLLEAAHHQPLEVELRRDAQEQFHVQRLWWVVKGLAEAPPGMGCSSAFPLRDSASTRKLRDRLDEFSERTTDSLAGFLEVETPIDAPHPGRASAKPFTTHHNALDMELFLRIAPELYLKRLVVGGFGRYSRSIATSGTRASLHATTLNYTMIEFYEAYRDYRYMMDLTEQMFRETAKAVLATQRCSTRPYHHLAQPFDRLTITQSIHKYQPGASATNSSTTAPS